MEEEKKTEETTHPLMDLRPFLPRSILRFHEREEAILLSDDHDYFDAVVACETARLLAYRVKKNLRSAVYSPKAENFALPKSPLFRRGEKFGDVLADLSRRLDEKRLKMVEAMDIPPLIEKFLDKMNATEQERKIFRFVLVAASGINPSNEDDEKDSERGNNFGLMGNSRGAPTRSSVSAAVVLDVFADEVSLADLMSLVAAQSKWVKQLIYERSSSPASHLSSMTDNTIRLLMGGEITVSQFDEIESSLIQETLREDERFKHTPTGAIIAHQNGNDLVAPCVDANDFKEGTGEDVPSPLQQALSKTSTDKGGLFDALEETTEDVQSPLEQALLKNATEKGGLFEALEVGTRRDETETIDDKPEGRPDDAETESFGPYSSELDYLEDQIRLMDKDAAYHKAKAELKDDGNGDDSPLHISNVRNRFLRNETFSKDDRLLERERDSEKLSLKLTKLRERISTRLRATKKHRKESPRLEQLCKALSLDSFERFVILDLIRMVIMPFHYDMNNTDGLPSGVVAAYIERFSHSLEEKMDCRKYFYKSSTLVKEGIITVSGQDFKTDLNMCSVSLDRRMFDYIIGLDTEFAELVDGSHLYTPDVALEDVILPRDTKDRICESVLNFEKVKKKYHSLEIDEKIKYGLGQVLLFYGASGTGKTMMANALAARLKKKILLVNFPTLGTNTSGDLIKFLFREARIKRAILFFDECESLFRSRDQGNYEINTILSELERFDDLCILATNRPCDLDEAMYRRLSLSMEFKKPDHILREKIWKTLHPPKLELDRGVDYVELARKYEIAGGFIKNAWLNSVSLMVQRGDSKVTHEVLEQAASEQVIGRLSNEDYDRRVVATCGIGAVIASPQVKECLSNIVHHAKAQNVLFGQWGFDKIHRTPTGLSALFCGPPGVGKTMAAEGIGFDLGRPLKVVNTAELVNKYVGETGKNIESVFADAKQNDAVLVFDEAEGLFGKRSQEGDSVGRHDTINVGLLLQHIENFSGVCIVITNQKTAIDEAFFRRFRFVLNFEQPNAREREDLWKSIIPAECPLSQDVSLSSLANSYEMCGGDIKSALLRAATRAALRLGEDERIVRMKDLERACEEELTKKAGSGGKVDPGMYA